MRVLLLGGSGEMGFNVVENLVVLKEMERLIIADNNYKLGQEKLKGIKTQCETELVALDMEEEKDALLNLMKKVDYTINCVGPFFHYGVSAALCALEAGVHFIDICDEYAATKEIFSLGPQAEERGIILLTGMGYSPGISNLGVKKIARDLQEVHEIQISLCSRSASIKSMGMITHLLYCVREDPFIYRDNQLVSPNEEEKRGKVTFLPPFGEVVVRTIIHPELYTLPKYIGGNIEIMVRRGLIPSSINNLAHQLVHLPLFKDDKYLEGLASHLYRYQLLFSRDKRLFSALRIDVWGKKDGEKRHRVLHLVEKKGNMVGISMATALLMLNQKKEMPSGVYAPEGCLDEEEFFLRLGKRGLEIKEEDEEEV